MRDSPDGGSVSMATRRPLLGGAGWLLFVCMFLPTLRVCGNPTMPAEFPPFYVFYVGSAIVGAIAWTRRHTLRRRLVTVGLVVWFISVLALPLIVIGEEAAPVGLVLAMIAVAVLVWTARRAWRADMSERAIALAIVVHAAATTAWNLLLVGDPDAMWGAHVALAGASTMLVSAAIAWLDEQRLHRERMRERFPEARVVL